MPSFGLGVVAVPVELPVDEPVLEPPVEEPPLGVLAGADELPALGLEEEEWSAPEVCDLLWSRHPTRPPASVTVVAMRRNLGREVVMG